MPAPVMLFTYSRPEHTRRVLDALSRNTLACDTTVYAYTCAPKNESHEPQVNATKAVLTEFGESGAFGDFIVVDKPDFRPLGPAMVEAVSEVVGKHGRIIVVEDDIVTSGHFLEFMNGCLDYYDDDPHVFSISGYSPSLPYLSDVEGDVYMVHRACPWGWATWKDRWDNYDWEVHGYRESMMDRRTRRELVRWNTDLPMTLDALFYEKGCMDKNWEQQFCYCQYALGMSVVCPKESLVENIGFDGTGTHFVPTGLGNTFNGSKDSWKLVPLEIDGRLQKKYNRMFVFRRKTRVMISVSNVVFFISPRLFYWALGKYYGSR